MKKLKILLCSLCILCLTMGASAQSVADIQAVQEQLAQKIAATTAQLESLKGDTQKAQDYGETLQSAIALIQARIDTTKDSMATLDQDILLLEKKLEATEASYAQSLTLLKKRIRAIYQTGDIGTVDILLRATSLYDFSLKTELLKSFTAHDRQLLETLDAYMLDTQADRDCLKEQKETVAQLKKQEEADKSQLNLLMIENSQKLEVLRAQQTDKQKTLSTLAQEDEALNAKITTLMAEARTAGATIGGDGTPMSTDFAPRWPLPGYDTTWVTCWYGDGGHKGLDIAGNYGAPIVAAQSGQVISADYHDSWGNNVLLYHNSSYATRYAHMSEMAVTAGAYVERGQTIGYVGSTGNSSGNHLHFEVYQNDTRIDPYPFL